MNIQIETVETNSFSMDYFQFGHGKDILVVLPRLSVQSVMSSADIVAEAYQSLTNDFTIYLFDRRKELPTSYSIEDMAKDTVEAIKALGLDQVNIFGVSQGDMIALEIAIEEPKLVKKLVLGSTTACVTETMNQTIEEWILLAKKKDAKALYLSFGEAVYSKDVYEQSKNLLVEAAKTVTDDDMDRFVILAESIDGFDVTHDLDKIHCPVLVLGSKDDQVLGSDATDIIVE